MFILCFLLYKILIEKGSEVNAQDVKGLTPLHYAVKREHEDCVEYLLGKGTIYIRLFLIF